MMKKLDTSFRLYTDPDTDSDSRARSNEHHHTFVISAETLTE
jgi:hypothetical protein